MSLLIDEIGDLISWIIGFMVKSNFNAPYESSILESKYCKFSNRSPYRLITICTIHDKLDIPRISLKLKQKMTVLLR